MPSEPKKVNPRKRRSRYASVACERCQRRKTKCSGHQPCEGCRIAASTCLYPRATRYRSARSVLAKAPPQRPNIDHTERDGLTSSLQATVEPDQGKPSDSSLLASLSASGGDFDDFVRSAESRLVQASHGESGDSSTGRSAQGFATNELCILFRQGPVSSARVIKSLDDTVWNHVLRIYEEEVGQQYPFLDIDLLSHKILARKRSLLVSSTDYTSLDISEADNIAFLVLAIVSLFEGAEAVEIVDPIVEETFRSAITKTHLHSPSLDDLTLLLLICIFLFLNDREKEAWRLVGTVMRLVHEQSCQTTNGKAGGLSDNFFWSVYTLDRRWSFGTGLPFSVPDSEIIQQPPSMDESKLSSAYLKEMVSFCSIASDVRNSFISILGSKPTTSTSAQHYLQFRVIQWQQNLPSRLQFNGVDDKLDVAKETRGDYKLRLLLYLRANQMRSIILRKAASRFGSDNIDTSNFQVMIRVARDSIKVLVTLAKETDIYHAQHKTFNHFLETALSSLLLVTCYASSDQSKSCLEDVVAATELIHRLARQSLITRRLKDKLQSIRKATDELRSRRLRRNIEETVMDSTDHSQVPPSFSEVDMNPLPIHTATFPEDSILTPGVSTGANLPIGLLDLDLMSDVWADTDPLLFANLSQTLGNHDSFAFF